MKLAIAVVEMLLSAAGLVLIGYTTSVWTAFGLFVVLWMNNIGLAKQFHKDAQ